MVSLCDHILEIPKVSGDFSMWWSFSRAKGLQLDSSASPSPGAHCGGEPHSRLAAHLLLDATDSTLLSNTFAPAPHGMLQHWGTLLLEIFLGVVCIEKSALFKFLDKKCHISAVWSIPGAASLVHAPWFFGVSWPHGNGTVAGGHREKYPKVSVLWTAFAKEKDAR